MCPPFNPEFGILPKMVPNRYFNDGCTQRDWTRWPSRPFSTSWFCDSMKNPGHHQWDGLQNLFSCEILFERDSFSITFNETDPNAHGRPFHHRTCFRLTCPLAKGQSSLRNCHRESAGGVKQSLGVLLLELAGSAHYSPKNPDFYFCFFNN